MPPIPFREALPTWIKIGLHSFGGPASQIAFMHKALVQEKHWISERRFLHALNYCMLLPGPEAMQLATYVGWLLHGVRGGLVAGGLFVLPGFVAILGLSIAYALYQDTGFVPALFFGLKAAVLAIVVEAVFRIGTRAIRNATMALLAAAAFVAIFVFDVPFPLVIVVAGTIGFLGGRLRPDIFGIARAKGAAATEAAQPLISDDTKRHELPSRIKSLRVGLTWLLIWWVPVGLLPVLAGSSHIFVREAWFFSKTAVVTFGGAYAVLAYIAQRAVEDFAWLNPGEMLDGLGMAETTPGPLIQVVQFVGFMGAFRNPGDLDPLMAGIIASLIVTWVTFIPCFLWIFLGAPYLEYLRGKRGLTHALSAITATVVGVILNLAVWFSMHVLFPEIEERSIGPATFLVPTAAVDWGALAIAIGSLVALLRFRWNMLAVLGVATVIGVGYRIFL